MAHQTLKERLTANVSINTNGCWVWQLHKNANGYGNISTGSRTDGSRMTSLAHRVSYTEFVGEIKKVIMTGILNYA